MSLFANLYLGDNASGTYTHTYQVVQCQVKVSRHHNSYMPDGNPRCDQLILSVIAPNKDDLMLFEWYIDQTSLSGKVVIDLANQSAKYDITERTFKFEDAKCFSMVETYQSAKYDITERTFKFEDAKCFSMDETYDISDTNRHQLKLGIMVKKLEIDETEFQ